MLFGDPQWLPHPVRLMGRLILSLEKVFNPSQKSPKGFSPPDKWHCVFSARDESLNFRPGRFNIKAHRFSQRLLGIITTIIVVGLSGIATYAIIVLAAKLNPILGKAVWVFLAYTTLATKDLVVHALAVKRELERDDISQARERLSRIVGRNTQDMSEEEIVTTTIESIAESTTDGIIAPLFFLSLGGPVLAIIFKAVSTLDSMIGHKSKRYLYFGWCAAKLDDLANYIPARISGLLIIIATLITGNDAVASFRTMLKDGRKQDSPNSAVSEAAMAGALGVRLGGACAYLDRTVEHPYLGEQNKPIALSLIKEAITISVVSSLLMVLGIAAFHQAVIHLFSL
jgi:adenosylcobinamide-phosphate synthase